MSIYDIPESLLDASSKILEERETFIKAYIYKGEGINISRRGRGMSAPIVLKVNSKEIGEFKNQAAAEKAGKQYIDGGMKESIDEAVSKKPVSKDNPLYKMVTDLFPDAKNIKSGHYKNHGRVSFETNYNNKGKKVGKHTREYQYDLLDVADGGGALQPFKNPLDEGLGGIAATCVPVKEDINDFLNNVLSEKAPPDEKIKKWLEDPKVQASFKDQYGERYKEVMFGKAWKMYDEK